MDTYKNLILQYSTKKESFTLDDLWTWLSAMGLTTRSTMNCMLSRMVDKGELVRIARGVYASAGHKNLFSVELTSEELDLARNLKERFPFAPFCIYNGKSIAPLQHCENEEIKRKLINNNLKKYVLFICCFIKISPRHSLKRKTAALHLKFCIIKADKRNSESELFFAFR